MIIREAVQSDAASVTEIWNWMIRDTRATFTSEEKTVEEVASLLTNRPNAFFVAEDQGKVLGFVTFGSFRSGPGYAATVEHSIVVHPDNIGLGVGRALMKRAMSAASQQGKHVMIGAISGVNTQAIAFHEGFGFEHVGMLPQTGRKNGEWLDLVLVQKIL